MGMVYKRGSVYWLKFYVDGRAIRESAKTGDHDEARRLLKLREGASARGERVERPAERLSVEQALQGVVTEYEAHGRRSIKHLRRRVGYLLAFFQSWRALATITTADVRAFIATRQKAGMSNAEVNRETAVLGRAFALAFESGRVPARLYIPRLQESAPRSGFFSREQLDAILAHLPEHLHAPLRMMFVTGWRKREVLDLSWRQVDLDAGHVRLDPGTTKAGEGRLFPFTAELRALLVAQRERVRALERQLGAVIPVVFPGPDGKRVWSCWRSWGTAREKAGLPGRVLHDFRRTACRNLIRAGVPEKTAMQMVGWRSRKMLDRYNIVSESDLRDAAARLDAAHMK